MLVRRSLDVSFGLTGNGGQVTFGCSGLVDRVLAEGIVHRDEDGVSDVEDLTQRRHGDVGDSVRVTRAGFGDVLALPGKKPPPELCQATTNAHPLRPPGPRQPSAVERAPHLAGACPREDEQHAVSLAVLAGNLEELLASEVGYS
ncbi:Uncharacterised protein [Mycobacteroides abscessus subsp. abscessus]|nr:Uncharacterised protein [Mycobacteroides abscessus subsp. abscessus]